MFSIASWIDFRKISSSCCNLTSLEWSTCIWDYPKNSRNILLSERLLCTSFPILYIMYWIYTFKTHWRHSPTSTAIICESRCLFVSNNDLNIWWTTSIISSDTILSCRERSTVWKTSSKKRWLFGRSGALNSGVYVFMQFISTVE